MTCDILNIYIIDGKLFWADAYARQIGVVSTNSSGAHRISGYYQPTSITIVAGRLFVAQRKKYIYTFHCSSLTYRTLIC